MSTKWQWKMLICFDRKLVSGECKREGRLSLVQPLERDFQPARLIAQLIGGEYEFLYM